MHAPLEDHAQPLLEMVGSGSCTPLLNHLLNLPLIQVTLDRVQPIPEFVCMFSSAVAGTPVTDPPTGCKHPQLPSETPESLVGVYDFCRSPDRVIAASETLIPVRSVNCDHLQCFDLSAYLTLNKKRPRWSCPVCSSPAPFRDLRRDDFFVQLMADQMLKGAEMVHVDADGRWQEASKPTESDSSAVISAKESIPGILSDNTPISAVLSPLNGTSLMSSCLLESNFSCSPVTPTETDVSQFNSCVILLDDDNDDQGSRLTLSEQLNDAPLNVCRSPHFPTAVNEEQSGKLYSESLASARTTLFVDLAASSDDECDATVSAPPLSNPETPATLAPSPPPSTTTESCDLHSVIPPSPLVRLRSSVTSSVPAASRPLTLAKSAAQSPPIPLTAAAAAVSTSGTFPAPQAFVRPCKLNKAIDLNSELTMTLASYVGATTAVSAPTQRQPAVSVRIGYVAPLSSLFKYAK
ncbi:unnamed protein product [Schistocephalus solidus]|uniref:SP-RING-type domain-containing protein n=1 Tax=Schistocephalus solidus TaxID=70667 RepID=A0A3P7D7L4_SCHSO|nr:unnamed protein product [Schistocephalus solidus]